MPFQTPKALIFDLGDVLFTWSSNTTTTISGKMMQDMLSTDIWRKYECGFLEQNACYREIAQHFSVPVTEVAEAFSQARDSLRFSATLMSYIHRLKEYYGGALKIYAMSNISGEDYEFLKTRLTDWSVFDGVFISGLVGLRKPDPDFYRHVLREAKLEAREAIFIDDKLENVRAAEVLGIRGMLFKDDATFIHTLRKTLDSPIVRGQEYLRRNINFIESVTQSGVLVPEYFAQLLILDIWQDCELLSMEWNGKNTWNFFKGKPTLVASGCFPDDLDITALALTILKPDNERVTAVLNEMLKYLNPDGSFNVYYDRTKARVDAVVDANVLACFYTFGRGHELEQTLNAIRNVLLHRTYLQGTRYYPSPDCCLFFIGRLLRSSTDTHLLDTLHPLLTQRALERMGEDADALELSMRIITCHSLGFDCEMERRSLVAMQSGDGGWEGGWIYRYGTTGIKIGNRGVTTAMAVKALQLTDTEIP